MNSKKERQVQLDPKWLTNSNDIQNCKCPICHNIFIEPVACSNCLNHFCNKCIKKWVHNNPKKCPLCKKFSQIRAVPLLRNILSRLQSKCPNHQQGCIELLPYDQLLSHLQKCQFQEISCPHQNCQLVTIRRQIQYHISKCIYYRQQCQWCRSIILRRDIELHQNNCLMKIVNCHICNKQLQLKKFNIHVKQCPQRPVDCPWCSQKVKFINLQQHQNHCQKRIVKCLGCQFQFPLVQFYQHQNRCKDYPVVCNICQKHFKRNQLKFHDLSKCIRQIKQTSSIQISRLNEQNQNLKKRLKLLQQGKRYGTLIFSNIMKDPDIYVNGTQAIVRQQKKKKKDRYVLVNTQRLGDKDFTWRFKIQNMRSIWYAVGITQQSNVYVTRKYQMLGHCSYLISANGVVYSNHNDNDNWRHCNIGMQPGDVLQCRYLPQQGLLKIYNLNKQLQVQIQLDIDNVITNRYYPCACLRSPLDQIKIIP